MDPSFHRQERKLFVHRRTVRATCLSSQLVLAAGFELDMGYVRSHQSIFLREGDQRVPRNYNHEIKHYRDASFHLATLGNALNVSAALQIALFHLYVLQ